MWKWSGIKDFWQEYRKTELKYGLADIRGVVWGASGKGGGAQTPERAFLDYQNHPGAIFEPLKAPRKFKNYYFFIEKINI